MTDELAKTIEALLKDIVTLEVAELKMVGYETVPYGGTYTSVTTWKEPFCPEIGYECTETCNTTVQIGDTGRIQMPHGRAVMKGLQHIEDALPSLCPLKRAYSDLVQVWLSNAPSAKPVGGRLNWQRLAKIWAYRYMEYKIIDTGIKIT